MGKFRVTERSFINNGLVEPDTTVEFEGRPGANLEPLDDAAQAQADAASNGPRGLNIEDMARQKVAAIGGDPEAFEYAQAANAAAAAAAAVLDGKAVVIGNQVIDGTGQDKTVADVVSQAGAGDLV